MQNCEFNNCCLEFCYKKSQLLDTPCNNAGCFENDNGTAPEPYLDDGTYTSPWRNNLSDLMPNFRRDCHSASSSEVSYIQGDYQNEKYFWFSADDAAGLLYRFDDNVDPTNASSLGSNYNFAKLEDDQSFYEDSQYNIIMNITYDASEKSYLQYHFHDTGDTGGYSNNTGGYVFNIKQTKCRRKNGSARNDVEVGRGAVNYVIMDEDPNTLTMTDDSINTMNVDVNGIGELEAYGDGHIWLKIKNAEDDYRDSDGSYNIEFSTVRVKKDFSHAILNPLFEGLKAKMKSVQNEVCICYYV